MDRYQNELSQAAQRLAEIIKARQPQEGMPLKVISGEVKSVTSDNSKAMVVVNEQELSVFNKSKDKLTAGESVWLGYFKTLADAVILFRNGPSTPSSGGGVGEDLGNGNERFNDYVNNTCAEDEGCRFNTLKGSSNKVLGGQANLLYGFNNTANTATTGNLIGGMSNSAASGTYASSITGVSNTLISGSSGTGANTVSGENNTVSGRDNIVSGNQNGVSASRCMTVGYKNSVSGTDQMAAGRENVIEGASNIVAGKLNHLINNNNNENNICEEVTYQRIKTVITGKRVDGTEYSEGRKANLKYYKTDFVDKESEEIYDDLLEHTKEMIQLQYGVKVDNQKYIMIMDDEEMDEFEKHFNEYEHIEAVFINQDVLMTTSQEKMLQDINTKIIPDCYFDFELREVGELW